MKSFNLDPGELLSVAAAVLQDDAVLLDANQGFLRLLPQDGSQRVGASVSRFFIQPTFAFLRDAVERDGLHGYRGLMTIGDRDGRMRTLKGHAWRGGAGINVFAEYDIAELERLNDAVLSLNQESSVAQQTLARANVVLKQRQVLSVKASLTDTLTGVGNRRRLDEALEVEINRVGRQGGALSVIMADLDHFKRINDEHGHGVGDKVLAQFGALLKLHTRPTDIVARFGGEEFIVLMPHTTLGQAGAKAEEIRRALAAAPMDPLPRIVTSSFGAAELAYHESGESLLRRVDAALYQAKERGRNRVVEADTNPSRPGAASATAEPE
ncbi:MAG: GGDEF domain-containing protein [Rhodanobacteraceae bacterium]